MTQKKWQCSGFSPGTVHTPFVVVKQVLHTYTTTTVDATQAHASAASLTETFVCVTVKNISEYFGR